MDLDRALGEAVERNAEETRRAASELQPAASAGAGKPKSHVFWLVAALALGSAILLVAFAAPPLTPPTVALREFVLDPSRDPDTTVRVGGTLVPGSLERRRECEYRFVLQSGQVKLPVRYTGCVVPDNFRDVAGLDVQGTVEGKLTQEGVFEATVLFARGGWGKYEMKELRRKGSP